MLAFGCLDARCEDPHEFIAFFEQCINRRLVLNELCFPDETNPAQGFPQLLEADAHFMNEIFA